MAKTCEKEGCNNPQFGGGFCKWHQSLRTDKKPKGLKRTELKRSTKKIKHFSDRELKRLAKYRPIRDKFLKENPICMIDGCNKPSTNHHSRGRVGYLLFEVKYFRNLCWPHHKYYEEHPEEAKALGISMDRL